MKLPLSHEGPTLRPRVITLLLVIICMACACRQKELLRPDGAPQRVDVVFDWTKAGDAVVEGMTVYFFPADRKSQIWRYDIAGRDGGAVMLPEGRYLMLAVNNDLPGGDLVNTDSYNGLSVAARIMRNDTLTMPTGMIYGAGVAPVLVEPEATTVVTATPDSLATVYHITVDSVSGIERVRTARAVLSGVARSVCVCNGEASADTCRMASPLDIITGETGLLHTVATAIGAPSCPDPGYFIEIYVTTSRATYSKTVNVTEQVTNSRWPRNVFIEIHGMIIPAADPPGSGSDPDVGIEVGVDGWQVIEITYS